MKYLEAREQEGKMQKESIVPEENKMKPGNRLDQKDPESLVSSPRRGTTTGATGATTTTATTSKTNATPGAQSLATELGVDLKTVTGTGANGHITEADVRKAHSMKRTPTGGGQS